MRRRRSGVSYLPVECFLNKTHPTGNKNNMINEKFIKKAIKQAKEMQELGESIENSDQLSLEAIEFVIDWWANREAQLLKRK
jgi:hypothetical protein